MEHNPILATAVISLTTVFVIMCALFLAAVVSNVQSAIEAWVLAPSPVRVCFESGFQYLLRGMGIVGRGIAGGWDILWLFLSGSGGISYCPTPFLPKSCSNPHDSPLLLTRATADTTFPNMSPSTTSESTDLPLAGDRDPLVVMSSCHSYRGRTSDLLLHAD